MTRQHQGSSPPTPSHPSADGSRPPEGGGGCGGTARWEEVIRPGVSPASRILIGTSGWSYQHWRGLFYPKDLPAREWLRFYARSFATVELNTSFYSTPKAESFKQWREAAGPGFIFAVKANRYITHTRRLKDPAEPVMRELRAVEPLGDALGPILLQLPPDFAADRERLAALLEALPPSGGFAVEFRHASWHDAGVYRELGEHGIAVCLHDWRGRAWPQAAADNGAGLVYVRFHGPAGGYSGRYGREALLPWADRCREWASAGREVYCYYNTAGGAAAVRDATLLRELLEDGSAGSLPPAG